MKELLDKLSSYNIFNYLLPGIIFVAVSNYLSSYNFILENDFIGVFFYYFIGMVISRFGSLCIEPLLTEIKFLKFAEYKDFVEASSKDVKIELLSEVNNSYRTIVALFVVLLLLKGYNYIAIFLEISDNISILIGVICVLVLFIFSYRKQTKYVYDRVQINKNID